MTGRTKLSRSWSGSMQRKIQRVRVTKSTTNSCSNHRRHYSQIWIQDHFFLLQSTRQTAESDIKPPGIPACVSKHSSVPSYLYPHTRSHTHTVISPRVVKVQLVLAEVPEHIFNVPFMYAGHARVGGRGGGGEANCLPYLENAAVVSFTLSNICHSQGGKGKHGFITEWRKLSVTLCFTFILSITVTLCLNTRYKRLYSSNRRSLVSSCPGRMVGQNHKITNNRCRY